MAKTALDKKENKKPIAISKKELEKRARAKAKVDATQAQSVTSNKKITKKELDELKVRDDIVNQYIPYASSIAARVCQTLSSAVDYEDVLCNARLGLIEAAKRYDKKYEVDFRTFAYYRIKGAIYDGLRRSGWLPRSLYAKLKFEEAANDYLQNRSSQKPAGYSDEELASETVNSLTSIYIVSLDADEMEIEDSAGVNIEQRVEFMQIRKYMRLSITSLPDKEKQLILMYYFQNRTLEEVGKRLGLSKSWTSRLHARALSLLFKRIRGLACNQSADAASIEQNEQP